MFLEFDRVGDFSEGFAAVEKDDKWGYINTKGEQIVECKFDDVRNFSEGFAAVKKDGKWGYINTKGEQIIECKFDYVHDFSEGFAAVVKNGRWGYINTKGEQIVECKFDGVGVRDFHEGVVAVKKDGKWGYINIKGYPVIFDKSKNEIMEVFDKAIDRSNNTFYLSRLGDKFGLLDENFSVVIKNSIYGKFEVLQRINETTFLIKIAERDLFVDSEGNFR
ncbi:WG repeat-containing protein [Campylobacter concisus]